MTLVVRAPDDWTPIDYEWVKQYPFDTVFEVQSKTANHYRLLEMQKALERVRGEPFTIQTYDA